MSKKIVLSGDIIAFTSLSEEGKQILEIALKQLINSLNEEFKIYGRIVKGDYIEMVVENPKEALTLALIIKSYIKSIVLDKNNKTVRNKYFKNYGIRIAIGYGELSRYDKEKGIIDGEAIYYSGRKISEEGTTYDKERIVIKNTIFFISNDELLNQNINSQLGLIDVLINNATTKQCRILYLRLLGLTEYEIAKELDVKQPTVNKQLTSIGWNAIDRTTKYFKTIITE